MPILLAISLPARLENLESLTKSVSDCARAQGFGQHRINKIELAAEETWVNICSYAYSEQAGEVEVVCKADDNDFIIEIIDSGIPFDITSVPDPDITDDADKRKVGGLGVFLMKKMVDGLRYRRESGRNILELIFKKAEQG
jgi:serine/threonine-protein kinase RsbW